MKLTKCRVRSQREGTPCQPLVIALHCEQGRHCSGVGDRMKSLQTAFWMVRSPMLVPIKGAML